MPATLWRPGQSPLLRAHHPHPVAPLSSTVLMEFIAELIGLNDATAVPRWADSSPFARDLLQGTGANQPIFKRAILNSLGVVRFTAASSHYMTTLPFPVAIRQPATVIVVGLRTPQGATHTFFDTGSGAGEWAFLGVSSNIWRCYAGLNVDGASTDTNAHVHSVVFNGADSRHYIDGALDTIGNFGSQPLPSLRVGASPTPGNFFGGDIAHVVIFSGADPSVRVRKEIALSRMYAIARAV